MNHHLIATERMYKPLAQEGFHAAQQAFFERESVRYLEQSTLEKWEWLLTALKRSLPLEGKRRLSDFKLSRESLTTPNAHVLSLEQCLYYFESIYFLHQTDHPVFHLNLSAKNKLLSLLHKILAPADEMCEAGRFNRFEELITEFRADFDWIMLHLAQCRELTLLRLHDQYNAYFKVDDRYKVHVLGVMRECAIQKRLGLLQHEQLDDLHMTPSQREHITRYFEDHYEAYFHEYEQKAIQQLSQSLLLKINDHLQQQGIHVDAWETLGVLISGGFKLQLMPEDSVEGLLLDNNTLYLYRQDDAILGAGVLGAPFYLPHEQLGQHAAGIQHALLPSIQKTLPLYRLGEYPSCLIQKGNTKPTRIFLTNLPVQWTHEDSASLSRDNQGIACCIHKKEGFIHRHILNRDDLGEHADAILSALEEPTMPHLSIEQENQVFKIATAQGYAPQGVQISAFFEFMKEQLRWSEEEGIKNDFTEWMDDACIHLRIKPRQVCLERLSDWIEAMLLREGYFIPSTMLLNSVHPNTTHPLRLKQGITPDILSQLTQSFIDLDKNNLHEVYAFILNHDPVLSWYPSLLLGWIEQYPMIQSALPLRFKKEAQFIDASIAFLYTRILHVQRQYKQHRYRMNELLARIRHEQGYFREIPADLLAHRAIALCVVSNNGLSLSRLSGALNDDDALVQAAITNDCFSIFFASNRLQFDEKILQLAANRLSKRLNQTVDYLSTEGYRTMITQHYVRLCADLFKWGLQEWVPFTASQPLIRKNFKAILANTNHFKTIDAMHALITIPSINTRQWIHLTQSITPQVLKEIIRVRSTHGAKPLPYCHNPTIFSDFYQALSAHDLLSDWASKGYLETKRRTSRRAAGHPIPALLTHLTTTKYWGLMYMRYQYSHPASAFQNGRQMKSQLMEMKKTLLTPAFQLTVFVLAMQILTYYHEDKTKALLVTASISLILFNINPTDLYYTKIHVFVSKLRLTLYCLANTETPDKRLASRCEDSIFRLQGIDNHAAHLKADHLETIWDNIQSESIDIDSVADETLLPYLKKKYPVLREGHLHHLAFFEVAAMPRETENDFPMTAPTPICSFFGVPRTTKTIQILTADHPEWSAAL